MWVLLNQIVDVTNSKVNVLQILAGYIMGSSMSSSGFMGGSGNSSDSDETSTTQSQSSHHPTPSEVSDVRQILLHFLPVELADMIIEDAEYWARIIVRRDIKLVASASKGRANIATWCYMVTPPIPSLEMGSDDMESRPTMVRKVKFWTRSCDQGWGGVRDMKGTSRYTLYGRMNLMVTMCVCVLLGTYHSSWTWFEASILRPVPFPSESGSDSDASGYMDPRWLTRTGVFLQKIAGRPLDWSLSENDSDSVGKGLTVVEVDGRKRWHIQRNVHVSSELKDHEVVWTDRDDDPAEDDTEEDGETGKGKGWGFVRTLRAGDRIAVLARALVSPFGRFHRHF